MADTWLGALFVLCLANHQEHCKRCGLPHSVGYKLHFFGHNHVSNRINSDVKCDALWLHNLS